MPNQSSEHYQNFDKPIIFFDSICRLCNHTINLLLKFDRHEKFYFAPLQGETAKKLLAELPTIQPTIQKSTWNSIIVWNKGETYEKSVALLLMAKKIGGILWLVNLLRLFPHSWREVLYDGIASNRYRWFGKQPHCRIPTAQEQRRFLP